MMARKKINKALMAAKFTKDTKKSAKLTDIRKQIKTAREIQFKPLTGLSKELNYLAREIETDEIHLQDIKKGHHSSDEKEPVSARVAITQRRLKSQHQQ